MKRPKWPFGETIVGADKLYELSLTQRVVLDPRLPAGAIDGLASDTAALRGDAEGAMLSRSGKQAATRTQDELLADGANLVRSLRNTFDSAKPSETIKESLGMSSRLIPSSVESVSGALKSLVDGAQKHPEFVRAAGVLPADLEEASETHGALTSADKTQNAKVVHAKTATAQRNETQLRVEQTMETIVAVACLVFRKRPELCAQFEATLPKRPKRKAKAKADTESPTT